MRSPSIVNSPSPALKPQLLEEVVALGDHHKGGAMILEIGRHILAGIQTGLLYFKVRRSDNAPWHTVYVRSSNSL